MTDQHPITPPPELVQQWREQAPRYRDNGIARENWLMDRAAQWGWDQREPEIQVAADQELEACIEWMKDVDCDDPQETAKLLRAARRPKPPSLKELALQKLAWLEDENGGDQATFDTIRRALEQLDD